MPTVHSVLLALLIAAPAVRTISLDDLPAALRLYIPAARDADLLASRITELRAEHRRRILDGEREHLAYYALQGRFVAQASIEPAASARQLCGRLHTRCPEFTAARFNPDPSTLPPDARARLDALASRLGGPGPLSGRLALLREILQSESVSLADTRAFIYNAYFDAARFLLRKEAEKAAVAAAYEERGFSTDTELEANYAVVEGVGSIAHMLAGQPVTRALIVGPGLDFAPRSGLQEFFEPHSYQPFLLVDTLRRFKLLGADWRLDLVDINPRVLAYFAQLATRPGVQLPLLPALREPVAEWTSAYREYAETAGHRLGDVHPQRVPDGRIARVITVRRDIVERLSAFPLDVVIEYVDRQYDLIVVTNVFPYFSDDELAMALANIRRMLRPGGWLLHNEQRPTLAAIAPAAGLPLRHMRSVILANRAGTAAHYDVAYAHRRE